MAVTDAAIDQIKSMILTGELVPGQRLPREQELAEQLGLSRNSLREAVKALSMIRVLEVRQGDGTYVTSLSPTLLLEALSFVVEIHQDDTVLQLLEVRRLLEPAATAMACVRIADDEIAGLGRLLSGLGEDTPIDVLVARDVEFHRRIAVASGNGYLASLLESLSSTTLRARTWRGLTQSKSTARTIEEHVAILGALESRQPELARSWATVHVAGVEQWLRQAL